MTLLTDVTEEKIMDKFERGIDGCINSGQMKFMYNLINQAYKIGAISENVRIYLNIRYEKKSREMESI